MPRRSNGPGSQMIVALTALKGETMLNTAKSFLPEIGLPQFPAVTIDGALAATGLGYHTANDLKLGVDVATLWGFGSFDDDWGCSYYYDSESAWYNGFYGGYVMRSYKRDGSAWGYSDDGRAKFDELFEVCRLDYTYITVGDLGCPPDRMLFEVESCAATRESGWDVANVKVRTTSGLHDPTPPHFPASIEAYLAFGIPHPDLTRDRESFAPVNLIGQFYMRQWPKQSNGRPISFAWGAACVDNAKGQALLKTIMDAMKPRFLGLDPLPEPSPQNVR